MKLFVTILAPALLLMAACAQEPQTAPAKPRDVPTQLPGEPVLAIPGQHEAPAPPPAFAPPVGDAGDGSAREQDPAR